MVMVMVMVMVVVVVVVIIIIIINGILDYQHLSTIHFGDPPF